MGISKIVEKIGRRKEQGVGMKHFFMFRQMQFLKNNLDSSSGCTNRHTFVENTKASLSGERWFNNFHLFLISEF